ncbi:hypothetical protein N7508_000014 [Penicillium antarcticum]|uniref:uncharacterized protein n=1 Tax=Penicillium antarcticum TaxID=416450 RepID=UPI002383D6C7|nr:uncharacterized protein N7508_000014 [Penicillium antarcticum]KAJ5319731.1 hypothetical protein N7508_000014 [Penicillium antarcticum]
MVKGSMGNKSVQESPYPMGIRSEQITEFARLLWIEPKYDARSTDEYCIRYDNDDSILITVTGKEYNERSTREFRDSSGLPLFEIQKVSSLGWKSRRPWRIRLPGSKETDLVDIRLRGLMKKTFEMDFRNVVTRDTRNEDDNMVHMVVHRVSSVYRVYEVRVDGLKVVDIRESMERNRSVPTMMYNSSGGILPSRLVMEVLVAADFDMSLASLIAVIICDIGFSASPPHSKSRMHASLNIP